MLKIASAELGVPLELTEENQCVIARDDGQELVVGAEEGDETIWMFAPLVEAGHHRRDELFAWALQENAVQEHTRGAVIGFDMTTDRFVLSHRVHISILSGHRLSQVLANLLELIDTISGVIRQHQEELSQQAEPTSNRSESTQELSTPDPHGFA